MRRLSLQTPALRRLLSTDEYFIDCFPFRATRLPFTCHMEGGGSPPSEVPPLHLSRQMRRNAGSLVFASLNSER